MWTNYTPFITCSHGSVWAAILLLLPSHVLCSSRDYFDSCKLNKTSSWGEKEKKFFFYGSWSSGSDRCCRSSINLPRQIYQPPHSRNLIIESDTISQLFVAGQISPRKNRNQEFIPDSHELNKFRIFCSALCYLSLSERLSKCYCISSIAVVFFFFTFLLAAAARQQLLISPDEWWSMDDWGAFKATLRLIIQRYWITKIDWQTGEKVAIGMLLALVWCSKDKSRPRMRRLRKANSEFVNAEQRQQLMNLTCEWQKNGISIGFQCSGRSTCVFRIYVQIYALYKTSPSSLTARKISLPVNFKQIVVLISQINHFWQSISHRFALDKRYTNLMGTKEWPIKVIKLYSGILVESLGHLFYTVLFNLFACHWLIGDIKETFGGARGIVLFVDWGIGGRQSVSARNKTRQIPRQSRRSTERR